jgi:dTDP-4-dehydrorhamnose 3,5-epimerase
MEIEYFDIDGVALLKPRIFGDDRGYFLETFRENTFKNLIGDFNLVQDNQSYSKYKNTIRGLHYQKAPHGQGKLVRCISGVINDVFVDIRPNSQSFGQWRNVELSAQNGHILWLPDGFLHGFCTMVDDCIVAYKVSEYYMPQFDAGIAFDDPDLGIAWGLDGDAILSAKDTTLPAFKSLISQ